MISGFRYLPALALCGTVLFATACTSSSSTDKAEVTEAKQAPELPAEAIEYPVDPAKSSMTWIGAKITHNHNGTINLRDGEFAVKEGQITGGRFVFDMASLRSSDIEQGDAENNKLTGHLLSPDFFDVAHHPTADFVITAVEPYDAAVPDTTQKMHERIAQNNVSKRIEDPTHTVTGNLTIKGITKSVRFPARIQQTDSTITAQANFMIDRTDWDLNYQSEKSLANKMIFHEVNIVLDIVASK